MKNAIFVNPNEAFFRQFFADESHIFHADMGHVINEACVETVAKIISNLQTAS